MRVHFVFAHPERSSFNGHLLDLGVSAIERGGGSVTVSDLYAKGFDPCESAQHFGHRLDPARFDAQAEQRHAFESGSLPEDVQTELALLDAADLVVLQYPMWWHLPPAILKGWFDRVMAFGAAYTSSKRFEDGRWAGKHAMLSVTVGTSRETYRFDGRSGDIDLMLWPVNFNLAYLGFTVLKHFVAYGVEGVLRYSESQAINDRLYEVSHKFSEVIADWPNRETIPFNKRAEWGPDGRIIPSAPVYSPFIRRREHLSID